MPSVMFGFFAMLIGEKVLGALQTGSNILVSPFSSLGAVFGEFISVIVFSLLTKMELKKTIALSILPLPLTYSISKIGCFMAGCCYGIPYNGILSVYNNKEELLLFPVQLAETICFAIIFAIFFALFFKGKYTLNVSFALIITCCVTKGLLYYLRFESLNNPFGSHQIIIISIIFIFSLCLLFTKHRTINNRL